MHPSTTAHITNSSDSLDHYLYPGLIEEIVEVLELTDPDLIVSGVCVCVCVCSEQYT